MAGKKRFGLTRDQALDAVPVRNELCREESTDAGLVRVLVPIRKTWVVGLMRRLTYAPEFRKIELDEIGSFVWRRCDGRTSVRVLVRQLCKEFRLSDREGEVSLTQYLRTLARRNLIGLAVEKSPKRR